MQFEYSAIFTILQREKELLRAVDYQRSLLEEAWETCVVEENQLYHLEEQIRHAQKQVNRFPKSYKLCHIYLEEAQHNCEEITLYKSPN